MFMFNILQRKPYFEIPFFVTCFKNHIFTDQVQYMCTAQSCNLRYCMIVQCTTARSCNFNILTGFSDFFTFFFSFSLAFYVLLNGAHTIYTHTYMHAHVHTSACKYILCVCAVLCTCVQVWLCLWCVFCWGGHSFIRGVLSRFPP